MLESKFYKILEEMINTKTVISDNNLTIDDLNDDSKIVSKIEELSFVKNNSCTINLPDSFKTKEVVSRYYHTATHNKNQSKIDQFV